MKQHRKRQLLIFALALAATALIGCTPQGAASQSAAPALPTDTPLAVTDRQTQLEHAKAEHSDTVAWLLLPGTEIDAPVMQAADNDYYLHRDESGNYTAWGCYFADSLNELSSRDALDTNTVIYGHSGEDENPEGQRFTALFSYLDPEFVKDHPTISLALPGEALTFQVAAVFFTDIEFDYIAPEPDGEDLTAFFETVARKNEFIFEGLEFGPGDKVLTLSTCAYRYDTAKTGNQRLVVMGKLLEKGASLKEVTVRANPNPERP